jgi:Tol biopolymer transport system component/predicted Ser/Thr protein kinase
MEHNRWQQTEELFHAALERVPAARAAFLNEACPDDATLRAEVEMLLASFAEAAEFIERPVLADSLPAASATRDAESLAGTNLAHYEILRLLGTGGMGEVYLARDVRLGREVALKLLPAQFMLDAEQVRRFEREARAASALNHPNILTIYDVGQADGRHFIATEFIAGRTLREKMAAERPDAREALAIAAQIAGALGAAHAAGIVHRDIKPENVMVRPDGLVKVLDFGLAKPLTSERNTGRLGGSFAISLQTDPRMLMGTLAYLSPEQARGEKVDARTDLFSLGVVLYEMLTGARPFAGGNPADTLDAIQNAPPAPAPDLPAALERIARRALEKDRETRYQSAEQFAEDLRHAARELEPAAPGRSWRRAAVSTGAAAALVVAGWFAWTRLRPARPADNPWIGATTTKLTDQPGPELFPSLSPDGEFVIYASQAAGNWDIWRQRVSERASERQLTNLTAGSAANETQPAYSPDGRWIAFQSGGLGGVFVMNADGGQVRQLSPDGYHPAWSADGREIYCSRERVGDPKNRPASRRMVWAITVATGEQRELYTDDMAQPQLSPSGRRIAYWGAPPGSTQRDIWTRPVSGGPPVAVTSDEAVDWNPVWSPDGRHLYFASDRSGSMSLWRVPIEETTGRVLGAPEQISTPSNYSQHPALSRDERRLAYVQLNTNRNLYRIVFDPARGKTLGPPVAVTQGSRPADSLALSPDGQWIVFVSEEEGREDLFLLKSDGAGEWRNLTKDAERNRGPVWSPDGRQIAFYADYNGTWEIWTINPDGSGRRQLSFTAGAKAYYPLWSRSASGRLVYTQTGGRPFMLDLAAIESNPTPQPLIPAHNEDMAFWPQAWSADGTWLAGRWRARERDPFRLGLYSLESRQFHPLTAQDLHYVAWLNDNRRLLVAFAGKFFLVDAQTGDIREILSLAPWHISRFDLTRDNRMIYFSMEDRQADIWMLTRK